MPNLPLLIKQAYQMVMVQNQGPEGGAQLQALLHPLLKPLITDRGGRYQGKGYSVHFSFIFFFLSLRVETMGMTSFDESQFLWAQGWEMSQN